ncbi:cysteate racemase [Noviherbaspirillum pedocola]|uniref:Aspartate/glutamate racemase family protein n=1 Tax=Noviherbaspirillum pedocola TaxID=2801341 RepID=A0A934T2R1_9BURK|nr:amino acid racemase [Noviherbaspirillum pedocola]MBK4738557.1 aspartate/glutamate racemase family protein [Noviherbaspirillum pedocola]
MSAGRLIGILGGMGPLACADLMRKIILETPAARDQDHVPMVVWNVPQVPDRQQALASSGPSPLPAMREGIAQLNHAGATRIAIACNTAHHWHAQLQADSAAPIFHIARLTLAALQRDGIDEAVGLIGTHGTIAARLYQDLLEPAGIPCLVSDAQETDRLFVPGCYAIKRGQLKEGGMLLERAAHALMARGAKRLVLACTEVPVGLEHIGSAVLPLCIDPTLELARACIAHWNDQGPM